MTANQALAKKILGYLPKGYILVSEEHNRGTFKRIGGIYANGKCVAMFEIRKGD